MKAKTDSVGALEGQLQELQGSFQSALDDVQAKTARVEELEAAKAALEEQLKEAKEAQASLQAEKEADDTLEQVKAEVRLPLILIEICSDGHVA